MSHPHATHLKVLGIVHLIFGLLSLVIVAIFLLIGFVGAGAVAASGGGDPDAAAAGGIMALVMTILAVFIGVMALPQLLGGWGLIKGKSWARVLILILSALSLFSFPLGTALGIYGFWALLHADTDAALASLNPDADLYT